MNIVIKYSLFGGWQLPNKEYLITSWQRNYLKSINTGDIFRAVMTE